MYQHDSIYAHFSLTMVLDPLLGKTCGILYYSCPLFQKWFEDYLRIKKRHAGNPMLVPLLLLDFRSRDIGPALAKADDAIYKTEKLIGTHQNNHHRIERQRKKGCHSHGEEVWKRPGFHAASREMSSVASKCLVWEMKCRTNLKLLEWIERMDSRIEKLKNNTTGSNSVLANQIEFLEKRLENSLIQCLSLAHRAEIQIKAVSRFIMVKTKG